MKTMKSSFSMPLLLAALLMGGGILAAAAHAMPFGGSDGKPRCEARQAQGFQPRDDERRAQHLASLKDKLELAPEQEAAWNAFAASMQPGARQAGVDREAVRAEFAKLSMPERMDRMAAMAEARQVKMAERAAAVRAFYSQLTPAQQKVFDAEAMPMHEHRGHRHHHRHST